MWLVCVFCLVHRCVVGLGQKDDEGGVVDCECAIGCLF